VPLESQDFSRDGFIPKERLDARALLLVQGPEAPAERNPRFYVFDSFLRKMMPAPAARLIQNSLNWCKIIAV
jgi:hypothetical protein